MSLALDIMAIRRALCHKQERYGELRLWIVDGTQNVPPEFFRDLPSFLNHCFDARDLMTVWLVGHPLLAQTLARAPYAALYGRTQAHVQLAPVTERASRASSRMC